MGWLSVKGSTSAWLGQIPARGPVICLPLYPCLVAFFLPTLLPHLLLCICPWLLEALCFSPLCHLPLSASHTLTSSSSSLPFLCSPFLFYFSLSLFSFQRRNNLLDPLFRGFQRTRPFLLLVFGSLLRHLLGLGSLQMVHCWTQEG